MIKMTNNDGRWFAVIMAGGQGTRFWPESTEERPKQLLDLLGTGKSLLRMSFERAASIVPPSNILVVTGRMIASMVAKDLPDLPPGNMLVEPFGRNTAPCIGWAALHVRRRCPEGIMTVLPADHLVMDEKAFSVVMQLAMERAQSAGTIVTIGIRPHRAETGYGYVEGGRVVSGPVLEAVRFVEKPDRLTAEHYLQDGNYFWNAGIFNFSAERILSDIGRFLPALGQGLDRLGKAMAEAGAAGVPESLLEETYSTMQPISIDYGVMEKEDRGAIEVIPATFGWSDLGSWGSIYERLPCDKDGNVVRGGTLPVLVDAKGCLLSTSRPGKVVAVCGVDNLVVIDTDDAVLICPRGRDQDVRKLTEIMKSHRS